MHVIYFVIYISLRRTKCFDFVNYQRMKIDLMGNDVIEIRDGDSGSAPLLEQYTASNNDNAALPLTQSAPIMGKRFVFSTSDVMYIIMRSSGSTSGTGFSFRYRQGTFSSFTDQHPFVIMFLLWSSKSLLNIYAISAFRFIY